MTEFRRARIKTLFQIAGSENQMGSIVDIRTGEEFSIEVSNDIYRMNEIVEYKPGRVGASLNPSFRDLYPAIIRKI